MSGSEDLIVVKVGGAAGIGYDTLCDDVRALRDEGEQIVLVHGGSDETTRLAEQLGHEPQFLTSPSGHTSRRTDADMIEIFQTACCGRVNKRLVRQLQQRCVNAVGLSGLDGGLWRGRRKKAIRVVEAGVTRIVRDDYTGTVDSVNDTLICTLLDAGMTPVLTPPGMSEEHEPINVDADRASARTASALEAGTLVILSNVPGLLREFPDESSLIDELARADLDAALELADGRMKKKVLAAREAIEAGVPRVILADARAEQPIRRALCGEGTVIT